MLTRSHPGYVFLLSVLAVGTIAAVTIVSLALLGTSALRSSQSYRDSVQAFQNAQSCAERALLAIHADQEYAGDEMITFTHGDCRILPLGGFGSVDRSICIEGRNEDALRRVAVHVGRIIPSIQITSWKEVLEFTTCPE